MNPIEITADPARMAEIGKKLFEQNRGKYGETRLANMRRFLRERMPDAPDGKIESTLYATVYHYWVYGCTIEECLNYGFIGKSHEEKLEYMTLQVRHQYMDRINRREDRHLLANKYESYRLFKDEYRREALLCRGPEDYPAFREFAARHPEFVVKPPDMSGGRGVHKAGVAGLDEAGIRRFYDAMLGETDVNRRKYLFKVGDAMMVEELIDQDERMAAFHPVSVNGVRMNTIRVGGKIHLYQPWFKVGRGGHFLTSAVFGTLDAGIDPETGVVDTAGMTESGEEWERHPDTGLPILGFQIPRWDELKEFSVRCAEKLPTLNYVGWDFVLSKQGWCVMEGNYSGDFMWQLFRKKGMKKDFEQLIGWKLDKRFWWEA